MIASWRGTDLIGEKLISFAQAARVHPAFARELPKFLAAIWHTFNGGRGITHGLCVGVRCFRGAPQELCAGSPAPRCRDHCRSSLVQTRDCPGYGSAVIDSNSTTIPTRKPSKLSETPGGTQKLKALDDAPVQFDQLVFGQLRDVWEHRGAQHHSQALNSAACPMTIGLIPLQSLLPSRGWRRRKREGTPRHCSDLPRSVSISPYSSLPAASPSR